MTQSSWSRTRSASTSSTAAGTVFDLALLEERSGFAVLKVTGKGAKGLLNEAGGHRWQRVPPTEKRGRVQTSTITVAVLPVPTAVEVQIDERDLEMKTCRGSGAGGQHRNVTDSAVQLTHKPTGLSVRCESERSQHQNRALALEVLRSRLQEAQENASMANRNSTRKAQVGCGARGDKRRTIQVTNDVVRDHVTGKTVRVKDYLRGELQLLW